ncbi:kinetochore-associated protein DSN1 homolog [Poeciliopsis prolifica]|uniref:kinetochore-associated protein DSN1 homolog n=1 Tax=Poeciliopsis prolifica TaxID=188132 RepID=UPI002413C572|nr:kinetochore-associated protein DSN1 homolog [Poeciliopsis prolifica]
MAEKKAEVEHGVEADKPSVEVQSAIQTSKRCSSPVPESEPPLKCHRTDSTLSTTQTTDPGAEQSEMTKQEMETLTINPCEQNKSWRRNTITRRSLPALPNPYESLCRSISPSLPQQERLEKLLEASMEMALERTQNSLESFPKASLDSFKKQVENIKMEWSCLTKNTSNEPDKLSSSQPNCSQPAVQRAMENVQKAISRLKAESESWEALLNKHKKKAEELEKKVKMGQETGIPLNSTLIVQSSQNSVIQSKPNYHNVLCRQRPMMHTMAMIMETQCKMIQQLHTIKEQSQLLVKKTSVQLAEEAGFQELSSNLLKNLMSAPLQKATT